MRLTPRGRPTAAGDEAAARLRLLAHMPALCAQALLRCALRAWRQQCASVRLRHKAAAAATAPPSQQPTSVALPPCVIPYRATDAHRPAGVLRARGGPWGRVTGPGPARGGAAAFAAGRATVDVLPAASTAVMLPVGVRSSSSITGGMLWAASPASPGCLS